MEVFQEQTVNPPLNWADKRMAEITNEKSRTVETYAHGGDCGDFIAALTALRQLAEGHLVLCRVPCTGYRMTQALFESLQPWIELQPCVKTFSWSDGYAKGAVKLDGGVREKYNVWQSLADMQCGYFHLPHWPREKPWMIVDEPKKTATVIFARSPRYQSFKRLIQNAYRKYRKEAVFLGLGEEHERFCGEIGPIDWLPTENWLEAARIIAAADLMVANQTGLLWVALSLHVPVIVETYKPSINVKIERKYAIYATSDHSVLPELEQISLRSADNRKIRIL